MASSAAVNLLSERDLASIAAELSSSSASNTPHTRQCESITEVPTTLTTERFYRPELDVIRFLAFVAVFVHHSLPRAPSSFGDSGTLSRSPAWIKVMVVTTANACGFGLCLFFALSAFLIGTLLLSEKEQFGTVNLSAFYVRRILRIWPLYFFGITIGCLIAVFIEHRLRDLLLVGSYASLFLGNWLLMLWPSENPMVLLWSISIEEQFYLYCPFIVKKLSRKHLYYFSVALVTVSNLWLLGLGNLHADIDHTIWYNSFVQFQMFGYGLLLCLVVQRRTYLVPLWARFLCGVTGVACWLIACFVFHAKQPGVASSGVGLIAGYTLGAIGCMLIIICLLGVQKEILPKWMISMGKVSFGLYVFHMIAKGIVAWLASKVGLHMQGVKMACSFVLTVIFAFLSYRFLEKPFLRIKARYEIVRSRPV